MIRKRCLLSFTKALGVAGALVSLALTPAGSTWLIPQVYAAQTNAQTAKKTQTKKAPAKKTTTATKRRATNNKSTATQKKKTEEVSVKRRNELQSQQKSLQEQLG